MTYFTTIKFRRGPASEWTADNPVLKQGEPGVELFTDKFKIGDGVRHWNDLPYFVSTDIIDEVIAEAIDAIIFADAVTIDDSSTTATDKTYSVFKIKSLNDAQDVAISAKADDDDVVKLIGSQSITGAKTFVAAPIVPDNSFSIAKIIGLQTDLDDKAVIADTSSTSATDTTYSANKINTAIASAISSLVGTAPSVLDTLGEISDALNDDANAVATLVTSIAGKQPLDSDLTTIAGLTATTDSFLQAKAGAWAARTIAQVKTDLGLSGTNSGDQTTIAGITGTKSQFNAAVTDGDFLFVGDAGSYTNEDAQDAVGAMVVDTDTIDLTYTDATPSLKGDVRLQMSITSDASGLKLSGDSATPGNVKLYGTDASGVKGWYDQPASGGGSGVTDGDKGDIVISSSGAVYTIDAGAVTLAKIANIPTSRILGRITASSGVVEELTGANVRTISGLDTTDSPQFTGIEIGHATDTTLTRSAAGLLAVEGVVIPTISSTSTLTNKTLTSPVINTPTGIVKGDVGLGSVDNTSDASKPISTLTQAALDLKQTLDSDLTTIAGLTATTDSFMQAKAGAWAARTIAQVKTDLGLTGTNSGDQTTIVGITGTKAQFDTAVTDGNILYVGDVTTFSDEAAQDAVGTILVDTATIDLTYSDATPSITADVKDNSITYAKMQDVSATSRVLGRITAAAGDVEELTGANVRTIAGLATGDSPQFTGIELGNATDTTLTRSAAGVLAVEGVVIPSISSTSTLTNKTLTSPVINTPTGIVKGDVGLGSVDNTSDASKPISTLTQAALDLKQALDSDLTTIAGLTATTDSFIQSKGSAWAARTVAQVKTDLGLTGTNSGDQTSIVGITGTKAQFDTAVTDGNILYVGDVTSFTDEAAQDAVGAMVVDTDTIDLTYVDATPAFKGDVRMQMSITSDASGVKLSGDSATPGNSKLYGTNGSGTKGWYDQPAGGAGVSDGDKGDITVSSTGTVWTIDNDVVTYAKMQNVSATSRVLGRITAAAGDVEELTGANLRTIEGTATTDSPQFAGIELGHATDTTIARVSAGVISVEGKNVALNGTGETLTTGSIELANASDTTLSRSAAGVLAVEGVVIPSISSTNTLTNKRVTPRTGTTTSSATPSINTDNVDFYSITALAANITSMTSGLSGTPTENQKLHIAITGTAARTIAWGTSFEASTVALPTTTVSTNRLDIGFVWNAVTSKWRCVAVA